MGKKIRTVLAVCVCAAATISASIVPLDEGTGSVDSSSCITLDSDSEVYETYVLDIAALGFTDRQEAREHFGELMSNRYSFEQLDLRGQTVVMRLDLVVGGASDWTKQDWVDYFDSRCQ